MSTLDTKDPLEILEDGSILELQQEVYICPMRELPVRKYQAYSNRGSGEKLLPESTTWSRNSLKNMGGSFESRKGLERLSVLDSRKNKKWTIF